MNNLTIPISCIGGDGYEFEECIPLESIQPPDTPAVAVGSVCISGRFTKFRESYTFRGRVTGAYHGTCCQCLASADVPFSVQVRWIFEKISGNVLKEISRSQEETDFFYSHPAKNASAPAAQEDVICLAPYVWEEVVFAEPYTYVCGPDCKGVCGRCGTNLNHNDCGCDKEKESQHLNDNQGLSALAKMFPELQSDKNKE